MLLIEKVRVDIDALLRLRHRCDPALCREGRCCCREYEITVTRREMTRVGGMMGSCLPYAPHLKPGGEFENPFEHAERNHYVIDEQEDGLCAFAYTTREGHILCALHSAALEMGLSPWEVKPEGCTLWPLALTEDDPPILTIQEDAYDFPCCSRRRGAAKHLDKGVADAIAANFGEPFLKRVTDAVEERCRA